MFVFCECVDSTNQGGTAVNDIPSLTIDSTIVKDLFFVQRKYEVFLRWALNKKFRALNIKV